ncbi:acyl-CoA dehydrogenase family protein [Alphaproteobacteria bacterium]|nr:acyl-CoA dehydrogenase family protein [Alphaproteobacteria bacterium]
MDFQLSSEQLEIQQMVRDFTEKEILPAQQKMDEDHEFPYELWEKWSKLGMAGMLLPNEYGGSDLDILSYIIALEEVSRVSNTFALIWQVHILVGNIYLKFAHDQLKNHYLPNFAKGEKLGAFALTEPGAGSDAGGIKTKAVKLGNSWSINGTKTFISNAGTKISDGLVLMAVTGKNSNGKNLVTSFSIPQSAEGYNLGQSWDKMAWHGMTNNELVFQDCLIPADNVIGEEGSGLKQALEGLNLGRIAFGAISTGLIQGCLDHSLKYAKEREQFGSPISSYQLIQAKLAEMATNCEISRRMTLYAASLLDSGIDCKTEAAMTKLFCTTVATQASLDAYQIHGGYGFMKEYTVNRFFREAKMLEIGEGTNEIMKLFIAKQLGC